MASRTRGRQPGRNDRLRRGVAHVMQRNLANSASRAQGHLSGGGLRQAGRHPRRGGWLPGAHGEAGVRAGPPARPQRRTHAVGARRRRQGLQADVDEIEQQIDELQPPVAGLGYNDQWPGPTIRVTQGDKVRVVFTNNLKETTGVHFHGVEFDDFFMDGVPFVTQKPIVPGETYTYEFTAVNAGSLMYHSHHNATDQVGRGLLGAFIVDPKADPVEVRPRVHLDLERRARRLHDQRPWLPGRRAVLAAVGETVRVRFMNEGIMMHPWHLHGMPMQVVARDGWPLGSAAFTCDTLASTRASATTC